MISTEHTPAIHIQHPEIDTVLLYDTRKAHRHIQGLWHGEQTLTKQDTEQTEMSHIVSVITCWWPNIDERQRQLASMKWRTVQQQATHYTTSSCTWKKTKEVSKWKIPLCLDRQWQRCHTVNKKVLNKHSLCATFGFTITMTIIERLATPHK